MLSEKQEAQLKKYLKNAEVTGEERKKLRRKMIRRMEKGLSIRKAHDHIHGKKFVEKNEGKKMKKNPVPEDSFTQFVDTLNDRASRRQGSELIQETDEILPLINENMRDLADYKNSFFVHNKTADGDDRGSLIYVAVAPRSDERPLTLGERNALLTGVSHLEAGRQEPMGAEIEKLLKSISSEERDAPQDLI